MQLLETVRSRRDATMKFIFESQGDIVEASVIDNGSGKDIVCIPTQTGCNLGCQFCYLSDAELKVRNLEPEEMTEAVRLALGGLTERPRQQTLLVSFMGCGEPMLNIDNVYQAMLRIRGSWSLAYPTVRFGMASLLPRGCLERLEDVAEYIRYDKLQLKLHLSLHTPYDEVRRYLMPAAADVRDSVEALRQYRSDTGNSVEIHYALMDKVNDRNVDAVGMIGLLKRNKVPVKFITYNEKPTAKAWLRRSVCMSSFRETLETNGIATEFYDPPGSDIGASCGQFLLDLYVKYGKKVP